MKNLFEKKEFVSDSLCGKLYNAELKHGSSAVVRIIGVDGAKHTSLQYLLTIYNKLNLFKNKNLFIPTKYMISENLVIFLYENIHSISKLSDKVDLLTEDMKFSIIEKMINMLDDIHSRNVLFKNLFFELTFVDDNWEVYFDGFNINVYHKDGLLKSNFGYLSLEDYQFLPPEILNNEEKVRRTDIYLAAQFIFKLFFGYYCHTELDLERIERLDLDERVKRFVSNVKKFINPVVSERESNIFFIKNFFCKDNKIDAKHGKNYEIKVVENKVYLRTCEDIHPNIDEIEKNFLESDIYNYDIERIAYAIENSKGEFICIGETFKIAPRDYDSLISLQISSDNMFCYAKKNTNRHLTKDLVKFILKKNGIVYGFIDENIEELIKSNSEEYYLVAVGKKAVKGNDASLIYLFDLYDYEKDIYKDLKDINFIVTVKKDQSLLVKKPATDGVKGMNIFGEEICPESGSDIEIPIGDNTYLSEDGLTLCASIDGYIEIDNGRVNVKNLLIINNLDYSVGNIKYSGSLIVTGDVFPEFFADVDGDIQVEGTVLAGSLKGRNIYIKRGIYGKNLSKIEADNIVIADFAENAYLSGSSIEINKYIYNSKVVCNNFSCIKGKGVVKNCNIQVTTSFQCNYLGSESFHETSITIYRDDRKILLSESSKISNMISEIKKMMRSLEIKMLAIKFQYAHEPDLYLKDEQFITLNKRYTNFNERLVKLTKKLERLNEKLKLYESRQEFYVNNRIYSNSIIKFNEENFVFYESVTGPLSIYCEDGKIIKNLK